MPMASFRHRCPAVATYSRYQSCRGKMVGCGATGTASAPSTSSRFLHGAGQRQGPCSCLLTTYSPGMEENDVSDAIAQDAWEWTTHCPDCRRLVGACACHDEGPKPEWPRDQAVPVCPVCQDKHTMPSGYLCTACPLPSRECGGVGAYCFTTPCACTCHNDSHLYKDWRKRML